MSTERIEVSRGIRNYLREINRNPEIWEREYGKSANGHRQPPPYFSTIFVY
jgi:hypothetical protein